MQHNDPWTRSICIGDYTGLLKRAGWEITHIIDAPPVHTAISAEDDKPDAEKPDPRGGSPFADYGKKEIGVGSDRAVETMGTSSLDHTSYPLATDV